MKRLGLALALALGLLGTPIATADTAPPCSIAIAVDVITLTSPTTLQNYEATMTTGGNMYFLVEVSATGGAQMALDYIVTFARCLDPEVGCGGPENEGLFTLPTSTVMGNGGSTTVSITVPDKTTALTILAQPFGRCGAINGTSTLHKFFRGGTYENTWFNAVTW